MPTLDSNCISTLSVSFESITPSVHAVVMLETAIFLQLLAFYEPNNDGIVQDEVRF